MFARCWQDYVREVHLPRARANLRLPLEESGRQPAERGKAVEDFGLFTRRVRTGRLEHQS
jgi:hypothetical protein